MGILNWFRSDRAKYDAMEREAKSKGLVSSNAWMDYQNVPLKKVDKLGNRTREAYQRLYELGETQHDEAIKLNHQYGALISKLGKDATRVYDFEKKKLGMHRGSKGKTLVATLSIFGFLAGIFFLSSNLTGNVISNMTNSTSNYIGVILLLVGIVGAFIYFKRR